MRLRSPVLGYCVIPMLPSIKTGGLWGVGACDESRAAFFCTNPCQRLTVVIEEARACRLTKICVSAV